MTDLVIDAAIWHIKGDPLSHLVIKDFQISYEALLPFLRENALLRDSSFGTEINDWMQFEIRASDFTEEGFELVKRCHDKWLASLDRVKVGELTPDKATKRVDIWKRGLAKLKAEM